MSNRIVDDAAVERVLDYLRDNAETDAGKRASRIYVEEYRKSLKAQIMKEHADLPVSAQEREAYSDPRYVEHLRAIEQAVFEDEKARFLRNAADAKIEAWRTENANIRSMKV